MEVHVSKKSMQVHGHASSSRKAASLAKESMQVHGNLPQEIIFNILIRIPAEFLINLKAVCKRWFDIISDRKFVNAHLSHHQSDFHYVVVSKQTPKVTSFSNHEYDFINLNDMEDTKIQLQGQQLQGLLKDRIHFESSYGGLLLFTSSTRGQLYVCNPVTRKCSVLPTPSSYLCLCHTTSWSLFHDDSIQKFMVVGLASKVPNKSFVYIPQSNTTNWKMFEQPRHRYFQAKPILIKKELHWLAKSFDKKLIICSLEVAEEKFRETQVPFILPGVESYQNYIIELNGSICVTDYCSNNNHLDIWTLKNREKCIWSKGSIITIPRILAFQWDSPVSIFHYSNLTKIVVLNENDKLVFIYDFKNSDWKKFSYSGKDALYPWCLSPHINSLVKFE